MDKTVPNDIFHSGVYKCAYCGVSSQKSKCIRISPPSKQRFIFYCDNHNADAERDVISALKTLGYHRQSDVLKQPVFAVLPEDLVVKSSGETGWFLNTSIITDNIDLVHRFYDQPTYWAISIINVLTGEKMPIPVSSLKLSLPVTQHELVDDLITWLSSA